MVNADIVFRKLHNNEIDDVPIEEGNVIYDLDTKQIFVDDVVDGVLKRVRYGGSEKLIKTIISANTTTKTIYDDTITTDSIIRVYIDEHDSFTYNSISTASGSVTITFNAMTQDVPIQIGIGAVSEFHQLITEGQASDISYNNGQSGMTATDVQEAIDELKSDLGNIELTADNVEYDNTTSGLQATNVQDAVDEITDNLTANNQSFRYGYENGEYGYYTREGGADTFHPFKQSEKELFIVNHGFNSAGQPRCSGYFINRNTDYLTSVYSEVNVSQSSRIVNFSSNIVNNSEYISAYTYIDSYNEKITFKKKCRIKIYNTQYISANPELYNPKGKEYTFDVGDDFYISVGTTPQVNPNRYPCYYIGDLMMFIYEN